MRNWSEGMLMWKMKRCSLSFVIFVVFLRLSRTALGAVPGAMSCLPPSDSNTSGEIASPLPSARLPTSLRPLNYRLTLEPFLESPWTLKGELVLMMRVEQTTNNITLNMLDMIILNDTVKVEKWGEGEVAVDVPVVRQTYDAYRQMYTAELEQPLMIGGLCNISLRYVGLLNDKLVGFYRSMYQSEDDTERWLASTQFSPTDARRAFPGFDEPGYKSTFDITLVHPPNYTAHSNMPAKSSKTRADGKSETIFERTPIMSTFIVAFHISDFESMPVKRLNSTSFTVWSRPAVLNQTSYVYDATPAILQFLEEYFGIAYALPKLDMVAVPDFKFSAMENWGLITYRESAMVIEPGASPGSQFYALYLTGHEVAHQWFGNLVTPAWWSELWLKEGFASFMGYLAVESVQPSWDAMDKFVTSYQQSVMPLDSLQSSHPINVPVNHPDEIGEIFDKISYEKGASLLRMVYKFVGANAFRAGLSNYLQQLQYSSADQYDLWRHLTASGNDSLPSGVSVETIMVTWTHKKGYPIVNVTRTEDAILLTQEQFLFGSRNSSAGWWIPITYTTAAAPEFRVSTPQAWMPDDPRQILTINGSTRLEDWIALNLNASGFYRVNYAANDWKLLNQQLQRRHDLFPPSQRAAFLDDALELAKEGYTNYSIALDMTRYLVNEAHIVPWEAALGGFSYFYGLLSQDRAFGDLKAYFLHLVSPWYESLGFDDNPEASYTERSARALAVKWACLLGHKGCLARARSLYKTWSSQNSTKAVIPGLVRYTVLCTGVAEAEEDAWSGLLSIALASPPAQRSHLLSALACTRHLWLLDRYLWLAFSADSGIRKHEAPSIVADVAGQPAGRALAWRFLRTNWQRIALYLGSNNRNLATMLKSTTKRFSSNETIMQLEQLKKEQAGHLGAGERAVEQQMEEVRVNIAWWNAHYPTVTDWIRRHA
ncbi:aminopeptidase N [Hyalella azteca]|uniref:Aminopeptidase n=1 Tax=Hyalella azteca TaxID=294128 RepID=A0A8B7NEN0_HYAAZ|nr:aminopeptidase N [Hyalella azteca]